MVRRATCAAMGVLLLAHAVACRDATVASASESSSTPESRFAPPAEWGEPEVIADDVTTDAHVIPLGVAVSPVGALAVCWSAGEGSDYRVFVAEEGVEGWRPRAVGRAATVNPPRPSAAFDQNGDLVVAWTTPWDAVGAPCFAVRDAATGEWSAPRPIHSKGTGEVDLSAGSDGMRATWVREHRQFSAKKLIGDVVHDPPVQPYGKVAVGKLAGTSWIEEELLDRDGLFEGERPRRAGDHVIFFRSGLLGDVAPDEELVDVDGRRPERVETVASYPELLGGGSWDAELALDHGDPIVAFTGRDDPKKSSAATYFPAVWVRERVDGSWSAPLKLLRFAERPSIAASGGVVHLAAVSSDSDLLYCAREDGSWRPAERVARGECVLVVLWNGGPALVGSASEKRGGGRVFIAQRSGAPARRRS